MPIKSDFGNEINGDLRNGLNQNFKEIKQSLDKIEAYEFDDMSKKLNIYETNMQAIVNILSDYDVPIAIVDGKVVENNEGE